MRPFRNSRFTVSLLLLCSSIVWAQRKPTIATFDAPGAGTGPGQGTFALGLSPSGVIEGYYLDAGNVFHGFVRSKHGTITTFDAPGAGTDPGQGTQPQSISPSGEITGFYTDSGGLSHSFLRGRDGTIISFDPPGAGSGSGCVPVLICSTGSQGGSINPGGTVAGQFVDNSGVFHGFVRAPGGAMTTFDVPNAGTGPGQGTFVTFTDGINPESAIAGAYVDTGDAVHAFVRSRNGSFATFDPPGSIFTNNSGITPNGTVTSFYFDAKVVAHGYVRTPNGAFTLFDVSGAGTGAGQGTEPFNINAAGDVTGAYVDGNGVNHGFLRLANGAITKFDVKKAGMGGGEGTIPICNNPKDAISGFYIDAAGVIHGFLRSSQEEE